MLSDLQRALLRERCNDVGHCIADPAGGIERLRASSGCGGGGGFSFEYTATAIVGEWHEFIECEWYPDGEPKLWRRGAKLAEAKVTYKLLARWCASLPDDVRAQALTWWRVDTRDLDALERLAAELLADPKPVEAEPADLLDLLALGGAA